LNQLGNTCYLNSLLQYFYTIKDLREAVLQLSQFDTKVLDDADAKLTEDNLKKIRVGGRNITRREIMRSRKCAWSIAPVRCTSTYQHSVVKHLGDLFFNLEYAENPAVTPELELAKLALVMSKDEEDDEADRLQTDGSNGSADTDATLVEDGAMRMSPRGGSPLSPGSILGKRTREASASQAKDDDIVMAKSAPVPAALAKRKATEIDSGMMFGSVSILPDYFGSKLTLLKGDSTTYRSAWTTACFRSRPRSFASTNCLAPAATLAIRPAWSKGE
jgi:ubiquitin carboxyl-terminal hydrolase 25/28